eukprot:4629259-Prymnesium_polylepis.1
MVPDTIGGGTGMPTVPAAVPDSGGGDASSDRPGERTKRNSAYLLDDIEYIQTHDHTSRAPTPRPRH